MKMFALILMTLAVASAEVVLEGNCPAIEPVRNFDISAYAGTWYHMKKIPVVNEANGECEIAQYTLNGDSLRLKYSQVINGLQEYVVGTARLADDACDKGKMILNIEVLDSTIVQPLWVLATDYKNYSIGYACKYDSTSNTHKINMWVHSRTKSLSCESKAEINAFISSKFGYIDPSKFFHVVVSENACRYHTSRLYDGSPRQH
uniref:Biliverdin binding protein-3 n=1 Tax=Antheraea pernyi TaxID=7119 RepID=I0C0B7_ANTPE|nr:biliverdin binding protein-3 [Antheraea pernyi]